MKKKNKRAMVAYYSDILFNTFRNIDMAHFIPLDNKLQKLVVGIDPVQDLHGYDNPWPSGGGQNVLDPNLKFTAGTYYGAVLTTTDGYNITLSGTPTESGNITTNTIPTADAIVMPAGTYTSVGAILSTYKPDGSWYTNRQIGTWTADEAFIVRAAYIQAVAGIPISGSRFIALAKGSTAPTAWTPHSNICPITGHSSVNVIVSTSTNPLDGTITNIPLGQTVYGGTLDVLTGLLTVDTLELLIDGTDVYGFLSGGDMNIAPYGIGPVSGVITSWLCDTFDCINANFGYNATLNFAFIKNTAWTQIATTEEEFNSYCQNTPIKLVMPLATPMTFQLTPTQISTIVGSWNYVWCDSGKIIELEA